MCSIGDLCATLQNSTLVISSGYWLVTNGTEEDEEFINPLGIIECQSPFKDRCRPQSCVAQCHGPNCTIGCSPSFSKSACADGYEGRLCSRCTCLESVCYFQTAGRCFRCTKPKSWMLATCVMGFVLIIMVSFFVKRSATILFVIESVVVAFLLLFGVGEWWFFDILLLLLFVHLAVNRKVTSSGLLKSFLFFLQTVDALLGNLWPNTMSRWSRILNLSNLKLPTFQCMAPSIFSSEVNRFVLAMVSPIILIVLAAGIFFGRSLVKYLKEMKFPGKNRILEERGSLVKPDPPRRRLNGFRTHSAHATLFVLFVSYFEITHKILGVFTCSPEPFTNIHYVKQLPWLQCDFSAQWGVMAILAIVFMVVYVVGVPLLFGFLLYRFRQHIHDKNTKELIGFLYESYRPNVYYFEASK